MTYRITNDDIRIALDNYATELNHTEVSPIEYVCNFTATGLAVGPTSTVELITAGSSGLYVVRRDADGNTHHDLPGFVGKGWSRGYATKAAAHAALWQATQVIRDLRNARNAKAEASWEPTRVG